MGAGSPAQATYVDDVRQEVLDLVPSGARSVLDIGCGAGGFGRGLRLRDPSTRIVGLEAVPESAQRARDNGYDRVVEGYFPERAALLEEDFDLIVLNDVLEHMVDPWSALAATKPLLRAGGHVVASIPNIRYFPVVLDLVRRDQWTYTDWGVLDRTHLRFFTATTMRQMFEGAGLEVVDAAGINSAFDLARWRRLRFLRGRTGSAEYMQYVLVGRART